MTLKTICNREVLIAGKDNTIPEAARLMREYHTGDVVIVEERRGLRFPVGIVTDRDIVIEVIAKDVDVDSLTLGDIMYREITLAKEDDDVNETIKTMRLKGIRRLPVVDNAGALIGIITLDDLIDLIAEQLKDLADLVGRQQSLEKKYRQP
ncbi:MAG: CBS domain-containing protein [Gammaproteobacteria bacterium]